MNKLSISIALCTYNGEQFLQEQLDSLAAQTRLPDEVVVGDDGSTDQTMEILERWAERVPFPVRITRNEEKLGFVKNFEETLKRCTKDILFLCDQDDVWLPDKLERMAQVFEKSPEVGLVYCYADCIDDENKDLHFPRVMMSRVELIASQAFYISPNTHKHDNPPGCCGAVRNNFMSYVYPFPDWLWHDNTIYQRIPYLGKVVTIKEPLMLYRFHASNVSCKETWQAKFQRLQSVKQKCYQSAANSCWLWFERINGFLSWSETLPESRFKTRARNYIRGSQKHYVNRLRVQRNFLIFCPMFFLEVFTGRYFQRIQPFKSMAYDAWTGIRHSLNLVATIRLAGSLIGKVWRKIRAR